MERGWKPNIESSPACPRCGSSNTKFCYYNNYSLTQPRYFCKGCRRYWTKGGSLRNVPIGGGCRKARRGKSARATADAARNLPHTNRIESSCSVSAAGASAGIDLAAVYANFLNQPPPENRATTGAVAIPPIEFSSFHVNHLSSQLPQESGFFECGSFPIRFSETQLFGNSAYFGGLEAAFQKQQFNAAAAVGNIGLAGVSDVLPPLPGEEAAAAVSEGMIWPSSNLIIDQNQMLPSETQQNSEVLSPFSGLNLEAIFRS